MQRIWDLETPPPTPPPQGTWSVFSPSVFLRPFPLLHIVRGNLAADVFLPYIRKMTSGGVSEKPGRHWQFLDLLFPYNPTGTNIIVYCCRFLMLYLLINKRNCAGI